MIQAPQFPLTAGPPTPQRAVSAMFTHSVQTQANAVKFSHQAMCNPKISPLMKALHKVFLKGCPNLSEKLVTKYINHSPATAKGHVKLQIHEILSATDLT
jgi:hypothetical protein